MKDHTDKQLLRILLVGFVLLAIGELYLIGASVFHGSNTSSASTAAPDSSTASSTYVAAPSVALSLRGVSGVVTSVGSDSLSIKSTQSSSPITITLAPQATIIRQGALLDQATQDADMEKFHAYTEQLMQDPQKNQYALAHLVAPSAYQTTSISFSNITVGDGVLVFGDPQSDGSYIATQIVDTPVSAQ